MYHATISLAQLIALLYAPYHRCDRAPSHASTAAPPALLASRGDLVGCNRVAGRAAKLAASLHHGFGFVLLHAKPARAHFPQEREHDRERGQHTARQSEQAEEQPSPAEVLGKDKLRKEGGAGDGARDIVDECDLGDEPVRVPQRADLGVMGGFPTSQPTLHAKKRR